MYTHYDGSMVVQGFAPVVSKDSEIVILGTLPGGKSLELGQYYADTGNAFWFIVEKLFRIIRSSSYDERKQGLIKNRIAIWDVLERAERNGSRDNQIVKETELPNDFTAFFRTHPSIRTVVFNGRPAEKYFQYLVVPRLELGAGVPRFCPPLPSTSGTNSHATWEEKAEILRVVQRELASPGRG
jgi:hypoxanthine-DNA glycosylase